ncbi:MAG: tRNA (adenosine(37)-N6)-threonylcarbamoyltransferase complex ATPase subunit type 1 TsaE [Spirochaetales bacterium]|nr:MAG: tRNA (adenosine(37)-N6)-threonylcarbamoyltransferase complex ATPase subunit type 1 TsaE [Spirochaetales bacterium]
MTFLSGSAADTLLFGRKLSGLLPDGAVVSLTGPLGAGKTVLVKGIARGLGIEAEEIISPSFTIIQEYTNSKTLYHIDLYRISGREELIHLGFEELLYGNGICLIEWGEKAADLLPPTVITVNIAILPDNKRQFSVSGLPE